MPQSFEQAIDVSDVARLRRRLQRNLAIMQTITAILLTAAIGVAAFPVILQFESSRDIAGTVATSAQEIAGWPRSETQEAIDAAKAYNEELAVTGQPVLGEAVDPFAQVSGGVQADGTQTGDDSAAAANDDRYQSLLDAGGGVMATVKVPKQSISLPVYHGTSEVALASGAGHLYGTSLPVGGESTHSVITGHRGLVAALMFTRLDEVQVGDYFYIEVMGQTLGYEVDRISVIEPDDTDQLRIVDGEDRVTLMTCTPYGVNTHRLLVSGHRVAIPIPAPAPEDVHDGRSIGIAAGGGTLALGWAAVLLRRRRRASRLMRHAAFRPGWPRAKG